MSLVIVGSIALDTVETPFGKVNEVPGGSSIYASMSSRNFCKTKIVGIVGDDYPTEILRLLNDNGICTQGVEFSKGKTFRWKGIYRDLKQAETLDTQLNVFADFDPRIPENYKNTEFVFLGNIDPELQLKVLDRMKNPKITACDSMNFWITGKKEKLINVIKRVDILFINEDELRMFTGERNIYKAAEIMEIYNLKLLVIKLGEYGALALNKDLFFFTPVYPLKKVIDTTGAGDCFAGGFMGYLAGQGKFDEMTIRNAMVFGTIMASFNIQDFSIEGLKNITKQEIRDRKEKIKRSVFF